MSTHKRSSNLRLEKVFAARRPLTEAVLEASSDVLRNPKDSHGLPVFDPAIRHQTDQVVLKFRKPW